MIITILMVSFLLMSAVSTLILISACIVAKRTDEITDPSTALTQGEGPVERAAKSATRQQPTYTPTAYSR